MDLNADLGEDCGGDAALMPLISRANIACGGHTGDEASMRSAVLLAMQHSVIIGAHPSYPDRENFGRQEIGANSEEIQQFCQQQILRLVAIARDYGTHVDHAKAHGALYHRLMRDEKAALAFLNAVRAVDTTLAVMGLPGSILQHLAQQQNIAFISEMFADRHYEADGSLTPRTHPDAMVNEIPAAIAQVLSVRDCGFLTARTGEHIPIKADTVCVHGDGTHALKLASELRKALSDLSV